MASLAKPPVAERTSGENFPCFTSRLLLLQALFHLVLFLFHALFLYFCKCHPYTFQFFIYFTFYICCAQTMDRDNPWIALPKVWIRALRNNPWIVCSIHGSRKRGTRSMDLGQTIDAWTLVRSGVKHLRQQYCST